MSGRRLVWKLGGSVLVDEKAFDQLASAASEYLRENSDVERLYLVVSAMKGKTDQAVSRLGRYVRGRENLQSFLTGERKPGEECNCMDNPNYASILLEGEIESAYMLQAALARVEQASRVVTQWDYYPIATSGGYLCADYDIAESRSRFRFFDILVENDRVVILSGFGAVNCRGETSLLGRNATDFIAAILSHLDEKVEEVVYIKDVNGIYENFNTLASRRISSIPRQKLAELEFGAVLDKRVLEVISCDFHVTDTGLGEGTRVTSACSPTSLV